MSKDSSKNLALFGGLALLGIGGLYLLARSRRSTQQVACLCVGPTPDARCEAIQTLLRPQELVDVAAALLQEGGCFTTRAAEFVASQVSYENDPDGCDRWCSAVTTLARGRGDCDDYALALATLLRAGRRVGGRRTDRRWQRPRVGGRYRLLRPVRVRTSRWGCSVDPSGRLCRRACTV